MTRRVESWDRSVLGYIIPSSVGSPDQSCLNKQTRCGYYEMGDITPVLGGMEAPQNKCPHLRICDRDLLWTRVSLQMCLKITR